MFWSVLAGLMAAQAALSAEAAKAPIAANPVVQVSGTVTRVEPFRPGEGMPSLTMEVNGTPTTVILCSMRFLLEQNFNPKAGTEVHVKGYKLPTSIVAIEVRLGTDGKTLKLRDENGWPMWRGSGGYRYRGGGPN